MRLNLDMNILRHMTDGVVVLDRYAHIVAFNKVAEPWVPRCQAMSAALRRLIDEERQGHLLLPLFVELQAGPSNASSRRADAWLCKNGRNEYAMFIVSPNTTMHTNTITAERMKTQHNELALIGGEVREQLSILRALLHTQGSIQPKAPEIIAQQCKKVEQLMEEVADLSQLLERDKVFADERLSMCDLIENIMRALPPNTNQSTIELQATNDNLGPVYGNGAWLSYALRRLIGGMTAGAPPSTAVQLSMRQMGDFLVLTGRSRVSHAGPPELKPMRTATTDSEPPNEEVAGIQMMICKRIIELHAGELRVTGIAVEASPFQEPNRIESFVLTLMTSMPANERSHASCADCRLVGQALSFATDMAQLIASNQANISDRSLEI